MDERQYTTTGEEENGNQEFQVISTSQAVNLTASIASLNSLAALFLCFADQRSRAIRRFSIQSVGLGALELALCMAIWILTLLLGWIPLVGGVLRGILITVLVVALLLTLVLRVRMTFHAYRGEAYVLPYVGTFLRRFE